MKSYFHTKTFIALTVAAMAAAGQVGRLQAQPAPAAVDNGLPANIVPGTPLSDVVKMVQAGVDPTTLQTYIANAQSPFNLDADNIIYLKDMGVSSELINAMMQRDKILYAANVTPPAPAPAAPVTYAPAAPPPDTTQMAPPPQEVTVNYLNDSLTPYGSWVDVEGYGRCWRPTAVIYDTSWRPYCDSGHWVYTDYGWYWDSDYSWGVTFHYGRWFHNPRFGWCWYPDTVWAPSWVTWRSGGDYCGWAPLPPFAVYTPGVGFLYRGSRVGVDFDFGIDAGFFTFISPEHFCDRHPRSFYVPQTRVVQVYHQTTVINNFDVHSKTIVNRGIGVEHITSVTHRTIEPVHVSTLANAGRQGWRGEGYQQTLQHTSTGNNPGNHNFNPGNNPGNHNFNPGNNNAGNNSQLHHGLEQSGVNNNNHDTTVHANNFGQTSQGSQTGGSHVESFHSQTGVNNGQAQTTVHQQQQFQQTQPSQQTHPFNNNNSSTTTTPNHVITQNSQNSQNTWQQNRNPGSALDNSANLHGGTQLQQHQSVPPLTESHDAGHQYNSEAGSHNIGGGSQGSSQGQGQVHTSGNGSNNANNNNNNNGSNKQNQNQNH